MPSKPARSRRNPRPEPTPSPKAKTVPLLSRSDVHRILADMTRDLAPGDVDTLMQNEADLRRRIAAVEPELETFRRQLTLAADCLRDHVEGECQQIPYYTITLLAAALLYFGDELDAIPDFLPHVGKLDDASVMAMACELAADGLQRYCDATGRSLKGILPPAQQRR
jgi:uncharacterized membrane protein YkvA (DUF1232 family)